MVICTLTYPNQMKSKRSRAVNECENTISITKQRNNDKNSKKTNRRKTWSRTRKSTTMASVHESETIQLFVPVRESVIKDKDNQYNHRQSTRFMNISLGVGLRLRITTEYGEGCNVRFAFPDPTSANQTWTNCGRETLAEEIANEVNSNDDVHTTASR